MKVVKIKIFFSNIVKGQKFLFTFVSDYRSFYQIALEK